jgi:hypothetical protein
MCVVVLYHDRTSDFPLRVLETRDENVYRPHGSRALSLVRGARGPSFAEHWADADWLRDVFLVHENSRDVIRARPVGGFDRDCGTWIAVGKETGVYARLLIAVFNDGTFAETPTPEAQRLRRAQGYAKRGGVCLDAVTFPSARACAEGLPAMTALAFERTGLKLLPYYVVVADAHDAFVLHLDEHVTMHAIELPQRELTMVSIRGINAPDSGVTRNLLAPLAEAELPRPSESDGWDSWLRIASVHGNFTDEWARDGAVPYLAPEWRSHQHSILQPPYFNVPGPRSHTRASTETVQPGDVVEWTVSSTCVAAARDGATMMLVDERQLEDGAPFPDAVAGMPLPRRTSDYARISLRGM